MSPMHCMHMPETDPWSPRAHSIHTVATLHPDSLWPSWQRASCMCTTLTSDAKKARSWVLCEGTAPLRSISATQYSDAPCDDAQVAPTAASGYLEAGMRYWVACCWAARFPVARFPVARFPVARFPVARCRANCSVHPQCGDAESKARPTASMRLSLQAAARRGC